MNAIIEASIFYQIAAVLVLASVVGFMALKLKQPLIVAFILTGFLAGPEMFSLVREEDRAIIETLAHLGIALLLFMVGLKLDLKIIRETGSLALFAGVAQVAVTFVLAAAAGLLLGFDGGESVFLGLAMAFSSTIIAVKLLSDRRALDSLYGRMALGILIIQDLLVIAVTIFITGFLGMTSDEGHGGGDFAGAFVKGGGLVIVLILFTRYVARPLTHMLARNAELLTVFSIAFAVFMSALCEHLHFSKELGGLIAGIALASTPYNNVIAARLSPLRDFMLLFFFTHLGAQMHVGDIGGTIPAVIAFSVFVLLFKPLIVMTIMHAMHFRKRTGFMTGVTLAQISEFSLILAAMGVGAGLIGGDMLNLVTLVGLVTMALSTYGIVYSGNMYLFLENRTGFFRCAEKDHREETEHHELNRIYDVVIFGLGRYGEFMAKLFMKQGYSVLGVDFDPAAIARAQEHNIPAVYGDAADPEFPVHLPLDHAKVVVFTFHHYVSGPLVADLRRTLAKALREQGYKGHIAATSHHPEHDGDLAAHGIDIVLSPFEGAATHGTGQIIYLINKEKIM